MQSEVMAMGSLKGSPH